MAKVAEGMARAVGGIATGPRRRSELAIELKAAAKSGRSEVRALLANLKGSRGRASREQATETKKATRARHGEVRSLLGSLRTSRRRASREYLKEAGATNSARIAEVSALLKRFFHERVVRRRDRQKLAIALRDKAAAFMRDLTSGVAALRDGFAKESRDRAADIRGRLVAYAFHRREAIALWRESLGRGRGAIAEVREAGQRPTAETPVTNRPSPEPAPAVETAPVSPTPSAPPSSAHNTHEVAARQSSDPAARSDRRPPDILGHRGLAARHERSSK